MKYEKGSFYIEDNNSKFGTLVLVKEPIPLSLGNNHVALQVGRTVLYFSLKKTKKVLNAFIKYSIDSRYLLYYMYYYIELTLLIMKKKKKTSMQA